MDLVEEVELVKSNSLLDKDGYQLMLESRWR